MCRFDLSRYSRLAVGVVMGLAVNAAAQADDAGVVRISDGPATRVVRAQSPEGPLVVPANCESGVCIPGGGSTSCGPYCPPHGVSGPSHGLVIGTSPTGCYDDEWEGGPDGYSAGRSSSGGTAIDCPHCHPGQNCPHCQGRGYFHGHGHGHGNGHSLGNHETGNMLVDLFATGCDKFLGMVHDRLNLDQSGGGGKGVPLMGHYVVTYPVDPTYFDGRDGQVYAAQGYGGPVSVPLAPVVRHTYNYGWGIPSSRLTPISHPIPPTR